MAIPKFNPSSILLDEQIPLVIKTMLKHSYNFRQNHEWKQAESYALNAQDACKHIDSLTTLAVVQLYLLDFYCQVGELGKAMSLCKKAYNTFHNQPATIHRHNEAVAAYAQGILYTLWPFTNNLQALHWYKTSFKLFKEAQKFWATHKDQPHFDLCEDALNHIDQQVRDIHASEQMTPGVLDVLQADSIETPYDCDNQGYVLDDRSVEIDKTNYQLHSGTLSSDDDDNARYCFALPVQGKLKGFPAAQDDDYVIVRLHWWLDQDQSRELANAWLSGVVWSPDTGWDVGDFTETPSGRTWFYPSATKAQIIGDEKKEAKAKDPTGAIKGYIIGLLKPDTTPSSEPSATASTPPPPETSTHPPGEPPETGSATQPDDKVTLEAEGGIRAISSTQIEVLDAVWLFSDDLDALHHLLESSGSVDISTNKAQREEQSQVLEDLPVDWLHLSVPESEMSITIRPRQVDIRRPHKQGEPGDDVVKSVREFIASRRHPLHFLGKRGWQLVVAFFASGLLLPNTLSQLLLGRVNDIWKILGFIGIVCLGILGALAVVGKYIPSNSQVTLWKITRERFSYGVQRVAWYLLRVGGVFSFGAILGSWVQAGRWGWFGLLGAVIVLSAVIWLFGLSVQKAEH